MFSKTLGSPRIASMAMRACLLARCALDFQSLRRGHDTLVAEIEGRRQRRLGTYGDDHGIVGDELLPLGGFDSERLRILEMAPTINELHAPLLREPFDALAQFIEYRVLPGAQFVQIDFRRAEFNAAPRRVLRFAQDLRGVEQGFGRDAAGVQADAAQAGVLFDESDLLASVGGIEGGGVTAGARTEDDDFSFARFHGLFSTGY